MCHVQAETTLRVGEWVVEAKTKIAMGEEMMWPLSGLLLTSIDGLTVQQYNAALEATAGLSNSRKRSRP